MYHSFFSSIPILSYFLYFNLALRSKWSWQLAQPLHASPNPFDDLPSKLPQPTYHSARCRQLQLQQHKQREQCPTPSQLKCSRNWYCTGNDEREGEAEAYRVRQSNYWQKVRRFFFTPISNESMLSLMRKLKEKKLFLILSIY